MTGRPIANAASNGNRPSMWAGKIRAAWQKSVEAIFEVGDLLVAAKAKMPRGRFVRMVKLELPFKPRAAECLMAVAKDKRLREAHHGALLPASWRTLYELSRLTDREFKTALADGVVHPEVERREVEAIIQARPAMTPAPPKKQYVSVVVTEATHKIVAPYYTRPASNEPPPMVSEAAVCRVEPDPGEKEPVLTNADFHQADVNGRANRLIDALVGADSEVREKAVELVLATPYLLERFSQAVRELAAGLDRGKDARRREHLRLIGGGRKAEKSVDTDPATAPDVLHLPTKLH